MNNEIIYQNSGLKRQITDKFYTNDSIVKECINHIKNNLVIKDNDLLIEPSAGDGSFISDIKLLSNNYIFYDLYPDNDEIIKMDYLNLEFNHLVENYDNIHIIGNPPFGRQSSLAKKFIKKSCIFCDSLSFILPKSFKKESFKKTFPLKYHLIFQIDLPKNSFRVNNKDHDVPCVFQIWKRKNIDRKVPKILKPNGYIFVKKHQDHDISFRRVGVYAGEIYKDTEDKSFQSHYFIKFNNDNILSKNLKKLKNIKFNFDNTVGPKSISKQELISEFNRVL